MVVLAMPTLDGAYAMRDALDDLRAFDLVDIKDAAVVEHHEDDSVRVRQAFDLIGAGALGGVIWGALIGLIFLSPWLGMAVGGVIGAIAGKLADIGIDDNFIREVGHAVAPGGSAVFLLVRSMTADKVLARIEEAGYRGRVLRSSLSEGDEARLREAFSGPQGAVPAQNATS